LFQQIGRRRRLGRFFFLAAAFMHWSSSLEPRFIPGDARIVGELMCPGCGYALRGLEALGKCPECGRPVLDAIRPIPEPTELTQALGESGWAFLTLLVILALGVFFRPVTAPIGVMLLAVLAGFRAFGAVALVRSLRTIHNHDCAAAAKRLLISVAIEFVPIVGLLVITFTHVAGTPAVWMGTLAHAMSLALTLVALLQIGLLGDLARRVSLWLELERMGSEATWSLRLLGVGTVLMLLSAVSNPLAGTIAGFGGLTAFASLVGALILATRALWRAAATIPRLDSSPATLIDRPLMSAAEMRDRGLLTRPVRR